MRKIFSSRICHIPLFICLATFVTLPGNTLALESVVFTVRFPSPTSHVAEVEAVIPTSKRAAVELIMPVWTPGYYRVENYARRVQDFAARTPEGTALEVEQPQPNRWRIRTGGRASVNISYRLVCEQNSVTGNWVGTNFAVLNGPATFPAMVEKVRRPYEVRLELPVGWERSMTALDAAPDGLPNHFRAADYDTLADSPILAGKLAVREFTVARSRHFVVDAGEVGQWDGARAARDIEKIVVENRRFWGELPFERYVFLNVFRRGGGGLEHKNSTLLTSSPGGTNSARGYASWLAFVCHEYVHAFNVKRLRPAEFEPIDYDKPPRTGSLWVSEGLTTYYGELLAVRAGVRTPQDFLAWLSSEIKRLQTSPGRLAQSLEQSSLEVWDTPTSGLPSASTNTVSYYVKGPIVGFLLDAKIQRATGGRKTLDDVMRLAYKRYSGQRGFTPEQFRQTPEKIAGLDLRDWFRRALSSTEELDYAEALDWFGLQFGPPEDPAKKWKLEPRANATPQQQARLQRLTGSASPPRLVGPAAGGK